MSLWWTKKAQLDEEQLALIEDLSLTESHLVVGPPGCGKTNVLLRRAQFARSQGISNVLVVTFTRSLTEFIKTGCIDDQGREIFPSGLIQTLESWIRSLYRVHRSPLPASPGSDLVVWKRLLAESALGFIDKGIMKPYDAIFVDEGQDLLVEELRLLLQWGKTVFFVGDDRQQIYEGSAGVESIQGVLPPQNVHALKFHYRLAPKICEVADKILAATGENALTSTCHYSGPAPASIHMEGGLSQEAQLAKCGERIADELRVYQDLIRRGDRLGVLVPRKAQRELVFQYFEGIPELAGKSQIVRARDEGERGSSAISEASQIYILTLKGCKGLEFRCLHWLFSDDLAHRHDREVYYTAVTRAKTALSITAAGPLPNVLLQAYAQPTATDW